MNDFLHTALTFPTVVYSMLLCVCMLYWLLAATGLATGDGAGGHGHGHGHGHAGDAGDAAAMLSWLGLGGVPLTVMSTTLVFLAWLGTYFAQLLVIGRLPEDVRTLAGIGTMLGVLIPAVAATSL
ncbi:MAG TPA: hypothetical protein VE871_08030, partial [Longimicrobium sp.]|nr:hypothetical protein [Longimicrobium sp.]